MTYERDPSKETYEEYVRRVSDVYVNVVQYLSHLDAVAQGAEDDDGTIDYYLDRLRELTDV
jgi:DNA repair ATPase RecN